MSKMMHSRKDPIRAIGGLIALACALISWPASAGPLSVTVNQARNDSGQVRCGLFDRAQGWRKEELAARAVDTTIKNGRAICDFGVVPPGNYAIAVFHAEHGELIV